MSAHFWCHAKRTGPLHPSYNMPSSYLSPRRVRLVCSHPHFLSFLFFFFFFLNMFFPNLNVPNNSSLLASSYLPIAAHCQRIQRCAINLILKFIFQKKLKKKKKSFRLFVVKRGQCHFFCTWNYGKRQNFCTPHSWSWKREGILRNLIDGAPSQISSIIK
jgi:hypothetical protein